MVIMPIFAPNKKYVSSRCARCRHGRERSDVWVVALRGHLILHAECATALYGDLDADLTALTELAASRSSGKGRFDAD